MASTRTLYDNCTIPTSSNANNSILQYSMDPNKYYNCNQCSNDFGLLGGNDVSVTNDNMVDLESRFRGLGKAINRCMENQSLTDCIGCNGDPKSGPGFACKLNNCSVKPNMTYLKSCKIIDYGTKPHLQPSQVNMPKCPVSLQITHPAPS